MLALEALLSVVDGIKCVHKCRYLVGVELDPSRYEETSGAVNFVSFVVTFHFVNPNESIGEVVNILAS